MFLYGISYLYHTISQSYCELRQHFALLRKNSEKESKVE